MSRLYIRGLVAVSVALAVAVWLKGATGRTSSTAESALVSRGTVLRRTTLTGLIMPGSRATVAPTTSGRVRSVLVSLGDRVVRGQELIRLDADRLQGELRKRPLMESWSS